MANKTDPDSWWGSEGIDRRTVLSLGAGSAALSGLGVFATNTAGWEEFEADFRGCSEVWLVVSERDLECRDEDGERFDEKEGGEEDHCPLTVTVVITDGRNGATCVTQEITEENATRIPGQYGDRPVIKYRAPRGEKILAVIGNSPPGNPIKCEEFKNGHRCADTPNTPDAEDAPCWDDRYPCSSSK